MPPLNDARRRIAALKSRVATGLLRAAINLKESDMLCING